MVTFLVDDNQWMDSGGAKIGDCIEAQITVFHDVSTLNYLMRDKGKKITQIKDEFAYFCGEILQTNSHAYLNGAPFPFKGKTRAELLVDCSVPILLSDLINEYDKAKVSSEKFLEGVAMLWGEIGFHVGTL